MNKNYRQSHLHRQRIRCHTVMMQSCVRKAVISFLLGAVFFSCGTRQDKEEEVASAVKEWTGKEILFPDSLMGIDGEVVSVSGNDYTILTYVDSAGCTGCRMKLPLWNEFMSSVDSVKGSHRIGLVTVVHTGDVGEVRTLARTNGFRYGIAIDPEDSLNALNHFPDKPYLQTFLLDSQSEVLLVGSPVESLQIARLYRTMISENGDRCVANSEDDSYEFEYNIGTIDKGKPVSHTYYLRNETDDTLKVRKLLTSCECLSASVSESVIPPKESYSVTLTFSDTVPGDFYRTSTVYFTDGREILLELSGRIR